MGIDGRIRPRCIPIVLVLVALAFVPPGSHGGAPVNRYLPWHAARLDARGDLLAWYQPGRNLGYDHVLRLGWRFLERQVPLDPHAGVPVILAYPVLDPRTRQGTYWQHNPASLYAGLAESVIQWYAYSGDVRAVAVVRRMLDYQLVHGTTPAGWAWPRVPFATSCAGALEYGRCLAGVSRGFYGGIEPDKVGLIGLAYLHFYELTGAQRYLSAARSCAEALVRHIRRGDATHTPWPFRLDARTGRTIEHAEYGGMVVAPVQLLDELARLGVGGGRFRRARDVAWRWLLREQLNSASRAFDRWSGYYEDVPYAPRDLNQASPTMTALYLLTHDRPSLLDRQWRHHARRLLDWVRGSFGRGPFHAAWAIDEQHIPGTAGCCSPAGVGSDTARWGAAEALLALRTGDARARAYAVGTLNYATYFARGDGLVSCCGDPGFKHPYWFSDGYGDYLGPFNTAMAALPELAPRGQSHLLESTSVVQSVSYTPAGIRYRTFDANAVEVLRLDFRPAHVLVGGTPMTRRASLRSEGYVVRSLPGGDTVVRVRHDHARTIWIER
jgi:hypothetical protein